MSNRSSVLYRESILPSFLFESQTSIAEAQFRFSRLKQGTYPYTTIDLRHDTKWT